MASLILPEEKPVQMFLKVGDTQIDSDMLSIKATKDIVDQCIQHLVTDMIEANIQAQDVMNAIEDGQSIEIRNEESNSSFVFQLKRKEKVH